MAETQTPIEALRRLIQYGDEHDHDDDLGSKDCYLCEAVADARRALEDVEVVVEALGEILPRLQYNHEALLMGTSLEHKIGSDPDCLGCRAYNSGQTALAKFTGQP